eukprot:s324_g29.t1
MAVVFCCESCLGKACGWEGCLGIAAKGALERLANSFVSLQGFPWKGLRKEGLRKGVDGRTLDNVRAIAVTKQEFPSRGFKVLLDQCCAAIVSNLPMQLCYDQFLIFGSSQVDTKICDTFCDTLSGNEAGACNSCFRRRLTARKGPCAFRCNVEILATHLNKLSCK